MIWLESDSPANSRVATTGSGFIMSVFYWLVCVLWRASLIEIVKGVWVLTAKKLSSKSDDEKSRAIAIDAYMLLKWALVALVILWPRLQGSYIGTLLVIYLLSSNLFSYFYYHIWRFSPVPNAASPTQPSLLHQGQLRRYYMFILSFLFSIFGFAYLYYSPFAPHVDTCTASVCGSLWSSALFTSMANAFTFTPGWYAPVTHIGFMLGTVQVLYSFFFLVIIITNSIPRS